MDCFGGPRHWAAVGLRAGLTQPGEALFLCLFYLFSALYFIFESNFNSILFLQVFTYFNLIELNE
jgi:hypothetical protein